MSTTIVTNGQIVKEIPVSPEQFRANIVHYRSDKTGPWTEVSQEISKAYKEVANQAPVANPITRTPVPVEMAEEEEVKKEVLVVKPINEKKLEPIEPIKPKKRRSKKKVEKEEIPAIKLDTPD